MGTTADLEWGKRLRWVIDRRGVEVKQIAETLDVSVQAVYKWMAGGAITAGKLRALGQALNVNWVWLRFGEEELGKVRSEDFTGDRIAKIREELLRQAASLEHRARFTLGALNVGLWELDLKTSETYWSPITYRLLGLNQELPASLSLLRSRVNELAELDKRMAKAIRERTNLTLTLSANFDEGRLLTIFGAPVIGDDESVTKMIGLVCSNRDFWQIFNPGLNVAKFS